jgi:hypothetical protein
MIITESVWRRTNAQCNLTHLIHIQISEASCCYGAIETLWIDYSHTVCRSIINCASLRGTLSSVLPVWHSACVCVVFNPSVMYSPDICFRAIDVYTCAILAPWPGPEYIKIFFIQFKIIHLLWYVILLYGVTAFWYMTLCSLGESMEVTAFWYMTICSLGESVWRLLPSGTICSLGESVWRLLPSGTWQYVV